MLTNNEQILIIDDDHDVLMAYSTLFTQQGFVVETCHDPLLVCELIPTNWNGIILTDIYMPHLNGIDLMLKIKEIDKHLPVLLITGHGDVPMAVEAVKKGAYDFFEKPINPAIVIEKIKQALQERQTFLNNKLLKQNKIDETIIGNSPWMNQLKEKLLRLSQINTPIYIYGESGTGRLLAAKQLHDFQNTQAPLVIKNLVTEMEGANNKESLLQWIEQAKGGTLIIKNIELLSTPNQQLLMQLQNGHDKPFRLIVISNEAPDILTKQGVFVPEFYYLFSLTQIELLPLRSHKQDIADIFKYYLLQICKKLNLKKSKVDDILLKKLYEHDWANNVIELIHVAELFAIGILAPSTFSNKDRKKQGISLDNQMEQFEKELIVRALEKYQGRINEAANYLQIPRKKLYLRMKKYQLDKREYRF
ncbi:sigma-54 dependent transcriptional regulator [Orbaceae bacterium ac157xtp]